MSPALYKIFLMMYFQTTSLKRWFWCRFQRRFFLQEIYRSKTVRIRNECSFPVIAFGWNTNLGYGKDVIILSGASADVPGPYLEEMNSGSCHVHISGEIICHEYPDNGGRFRVLHGFPLSIQQRNAGVTVRHCEDEPEEHVTEWRNDHT